MVCINPFSLRFISKQCFLSSINVLMQYTIIFRRSLLNTSSSTIFQYMQLTITFAIEVKLSMFELFWYFSIKIIIKYGSFDRPKTTSLTKVYTSPKPSSSSSRFYYQYFMFLSLLSLSTEEFALFIDLSILDFY